MKRTIKARIDRIAAKMGAAVDARCFCTMRDGSERTYYGMTVIQDLLDENIKAIRTHDADTAALLRAFNVKDTTVDII